MARNSDRTLIQFLLTIAFVVVVAFFNWIKRRSEQQEPTDATSEPRVPPQPRPNRSLPRQAAQPVPPPAASKPPPQKIDWQEELRRMLQGPETAPPPLPPQPVHPQPQRAPATPPVITLPPLHAPRPAPIRPVVVEQAQGLPVEFAGLTASGESYRRASQLDDNVAERLRQIKDQVQRHKPNRQVGESSAAVAQTLALVRSRQSLRAAIMASVILGPPKASES